MKLKLRQYLLYACVSFMSFNVTVIIVTLFYTPNNASLRSSRRHVEPDDVAFNEQHLDQQQQQQQRHHHQPEQQQQEEEQQQIQQVQQQPRDDADDNIEPASRHNFRLPNKLITEYDLDVAERVTSLAARKAPSLDPELIKLVLDVIDWPPSNNAGYKMFKVSKTPQVAEVETLLQEMRNGFFVECGGLDGERLSNTAFLEQERNWQGLLIEMDPFFYTQLLGKNRRVWSLNACLSPYNYFTTLPYAGDTRGRGQLIDDNQDAPRRSRASAKQKVVPCFPFETILTALNRTQVDYFSLDVEGFELPILKSINWKNVDIKVMSVEFNRGKDKTAYSEYMESQGYKTLKELHNGPFFVHDFIFVGQNLYDSLTDDEKRQPVKALKSNKLKNRQIAIV